MMPCWLFGPTASTSSRPNPSSTLLPDMQIQLDKFNLLLLLLLEAVGSFDTSSDSPVRWDSSTLTHSQQEEEQRWQQGQTQMSEWVSGNEMQVRARGARRQSCGVDVWTCKRCQA